MKVMKFGGSSLENPERIAAAADIIEASHALEKVAVIHADAEQAAHQVAEGLAPVLPHREIRVVPAGQVVATHVGPGAVGVACVLAR